MATQTGFQQPTTAIFPEVPLTGDIEWIAWAQEITTFLSAQVKTFNIPGLVTGVSAVANNLVIVLSWNATKQATNYRIYRNTTGDFNSAQIVATLPASKTGISTLTYQDSRDSISNSRYYWVSGLNERGIEGPKSAMVAVTNYQVSATGASFGINAAASGTSSVAGGINASAAGDSSVSIGDSASAGGTQSVAIGASATTAALASSAVALGQGASVTQGFGMALGEASASFFTKAVALGAAAATTAANQFMKGGQIAFYFTDETRVCGANGQLFSEKTLTELTTIAAGASTLTAIQIPGDAVVLAVSVRVTVTIPTAATFTVTAAAVGTQFDVAGGVSTAANTTDVGTRNCPIHSISAQSIQITPNLVPANNSGRVRVTIHYYQITAPTS